MLRGSPETRWEMRSSQVRAGWVLGWSSFIALEAEPGAGERRILADFQCRFNKAIKFI
jgi:hypothetical protein